jgi:hypothetical protein
MMMSIMIIIIIIIVIFIVVIMTAITLMATNDVGLYLHCIVIVDMFGRIPYFAETIRDSTFSEPYLR